MYTPENLEFETMKKKTIKKIIIKSKHLAVISVIVAFIMISVQYSQVVPVVEATDQDNDGLPDVEEEILFLDYHENTGIILNAKIEPTRGGPPPNCVNVGGTRAGHEYDSSWNETIMSIRSHYKIDVTTSNMQNPPVTLSFRISNQETNQTEYTHQWLVPDNGTYQLPDATGITSGTNPYALINITISALGNSTLTIDYTLRTNTDKDKNDTDGDGLLNDYMDNDDDGDGIENGGEIL